MSTTIAILTKLYQFPNFKSWTWNLTINYKKSLMSSHNRRNLWWIVQFVKYMLTFVICNAEVYSNFTPILVTRQHQTVWPNIYHIHPQVHVGGQYGNCLALWICRIVFGQRACVHQSTFCISVDSLQCIVIEFH